jgi:hypothetical protein
MIANANYSMHHLQEELAKDDDDFSFVYTGRRLCHMFQTIGLCYVAGRRACNEGLSLPSLSLIKEPQ